MKSLSMKKLTKRNKILFGALGVIVVVVVVGLILSLTGVINLPLQGQIMAGNLYPSQACVVVGQTQTFTLKDWAFGTNWQLYSSHVKEVSHDRTHFTIHGVSENPHYNEWIKVFGSKGLWKLDQSYFEVKASCP